MRRMGDRNRIGITINLVKLRRSNSIRRGIDTTIRPRTDNPKLNTTLREMDTIHVLPTTIPLCNETTMLGTIDRRRGTPKRRRGMISVRIGMATIGGTGTEGLTSADRRSMAVMIGMVEGEGQGEGMERIGIGRKGMGRMEMRRLVLLLRRRSSLRLLVVSEKGV